MTRGARPAPAPMQSNHEQAPPTPNSTVSSLSIGPLEVSRASTLGSPSDGAGDRDRELEPSEPRRLINPMTLAGGEIFSYHRKPPRYVQEYRGNTSHSAILLETKELVSEDVWNNFHRDAPDLDCSNADEICHMGVAVLSWLPQPKDALDALDHYLRYSTARSLQPTVARRFAEDFFSTFGDLIKDSTQTETLSHVCCILSRNQSTTVTVPESSREFLDSFTGMRSRWDTLGMLFCYYAMAVIMTPIGRCLPRGLTQALGRNVEVRELNTKEKREIASNFMDCAEACLLMCEENEGGESIFTISLLFKITCVQSVLGGEFQETTRIAAVPWLT